MNDNLIIVFQTLREKYNQELDLFCSKTQKKERTSHLFKLKSISSALNIIKSIDYKIVSGYQLKDIKGIGSKTIEKIDEILNTGTLKSLENYKSKDSSIIVKELQRITGIGPAKAKLLYEKNITVNSLLELLKDKDKEHLDNILTHHQQIGLKYMYDFEKRIPYDEIKSIENYLTSIIKKPMEFIICGSYRRCKQTSGDVDILIYSEIENNPEYLKELIEYLTEKEFLIDHLTKDGSTKYMGVYSYKGGTPRRIDIRYIKKEHIASSMLYFTGSGNFNKNMRTYANKLGYRLNEYGLYKLKKDGTPGLKLKTPNEQSIFKLLKIDYVEPKNRTDFIHF